MRSLLLDYRCDCGHLLFKGLLFGSRLEIKCKKCAKLTYLSEFESDDPDNYYVIVFNKAGSIIDAGLSASLILGYRHEDMLQKKIFDIAPHITPEGYRRMWDKLMKSHYMRRRMECIPKKLFQ